MAGPPPFLCLLPPTRQVRSGPPPFLLPEAPTIRWLLGGWGGEIWLGGVGGLLVGQVWVPTPWWTQNRPPGS